MNLMQKFLDDRKALNKNWRLKYIDSVNAPYLEISDPSILAGFTGYLKFQCRKVEEEGKVFYRGQIRDYDLIPSIFREYNGIAIDNSRIILRLKAFNELVKKTPQLFENASRFTNENLESIFQHYGIRTPWIDLVDNIFVSIWFAICKFEKGIEGRIECKPTDEKYGWIYYFLVNDGIKYYDLREHHSSLSLRLHSQHGISATRKESNWNIFNRNLNDNVCARVKFPITKDWLLKGNIFNQAFMFPSGKLDNTYKYLKNKKFSELLLKIVNEYGLENDELGQITDYG